MCSLLILSLSLFSLVFSLVIVSGVFVACSRLLQLISAPRGACLRWQRGHTRVRHGAGRWQREQQRPADPASPRATRPPSSRPRTFLSPALPPTGLPFHICICCTLLLSRMGCAECLEASKGDNGEMDTGGVRRTALSASLSVFLSFVSCRFS